MCKKGEKQSSVLKTYVEILLGSELFACVHIHLVEWSHLNECEKYVLTKMSKEHQIYFCFQKIDICFGHISNDFYSSVACFIIICLILWWVMSPIFKRKKIWTNKKENAKNVNLFEIEEVSVICLADAIIWNLLTVTQHTRSHENIMYRKWSKKV